MKETVVGIVAAVPILFGAIKAMIEKRYVTLMVTLTARSGICFVWAILWAVRH